MSWGASSYVEFFRAAEETIRRNAEGLDAADRARQHADAVEKYGTEITNCMAPRAGNERDE